jgi:uncharacterized protein YwbE
MVDIVLKHGQRTGSPTRSVVNASWINPLIDRKAPM